VLADAVPVPSSSSFALTRGRLWADDRVSLSNTFSSYTVTFDIIDTSVPLVATLVWWDPPVSVVSPIIIANDFDLTCFPPNGTKNQFAVYTGAAMALLPVTILTTITSFCSRQWLHGTRFVWHCTSGVRSLQRE
jgi:hypothetical protein